MGYLNIVDKCLNIAGSGGNKSSPSSSRRQKEQAKPDLKVNSSPTTLERSSSTRVRRMSSGRKVPVGNGAETSRGMLSPRASVSNGSDGDKQNGERANRRLSTYLLTPEEEKPNVSYASYNFLLVDDNVINLRILSKTLAKLYPCCRTVTLSDSTSVMSTVKKQKFDLLFLDIEMPSLSGVDLARLIRKDTKHARLGLIAVTSKARSKDLELYRKSGIDHTFPKPLSTDYSTVMKYIESVIVSRRRR